MVNLKLMLLVLDEGLDRKVKSLFNKFGIRVKTVSSANGTASPSVLDYFGLTETKKDMFLALIPDYLKNKILSKIKTDFKLDREGTGILIVIPVSSSNKFLVDEFNSQEGSEILMENSIKQNYHLVVTIVSEGYLEQVMNAVKKAGGNGGTVIKGRGLGNSIRTKILGFNIEPEKDIVLNLVLDKNKTKVMEAISKDVGIKTKGKGVCFSLPVEDAVGLELYE